MELGKMTLQQLQAQGWVTRNKELSHQIGWGYKVLQYNSLLGCMAMSSSIWSQKQLEDPETQKRLFSQFV